MSFSDDLFEQATFLLHRGRTRPKQASLRRAVSSAYYSLFHLIVEDGCNLLFGSVSANDNVSLIAYRSFVHSDMRETSKQYAKPYANMNSKFRQIALPQNSPDIQFIAKTFLQLQQLRHRADYDASYAFSKSHVLLCLQITHEAINTWKNLKKSNRLHLRNFAAAMLLAKTTRMGIQ